MDREFRRIAIFLKPKKAATDLAFNEKFYDNLIKTIEDVDLPANWSYYLAGRYMSEPMQNRMLRNDIGKTSALTILVLFLTMVIFFRSLRAIVAVGLPLIVGISWTFALTHLFIGRISLISAFLASILLGLGIDYGIHLYSRFKEERVGGKGVSEALVVTFISMSSSIGFGAFTTSVAFLSLGFARFQAFAEFGLMAFLGIICCLLAFVLTFPTMIFISERFSSDRLPAAKVSQGHLRYHYVWFILVALLNVAGVFFLPSLKFEYNFANLNTETPRLEVAREKLSSIIERSDNPIVYDVSSLDDLRSLHNTFKDKPSKYVGSTQSILMFKPNDEKQKRKHIRQMNLLLRKARYFIKDDEQKRRKLEEAIFYTEVGDFSLKKLPAKLRNLLMKENADKTHYFYYVYPRNLEQAPRGIIDFASENRFACLKKDTAPGVCPDEAVKRGAADSIILQDILELILTDISQGTFVVFLIVLVLIIAISRNLAAFIVIFVPLLSGFLLLVGLLSLGEMLTGALIFKLNYINVVAVPVLMGVGIDNGLHLYRRYKEKKFTDLTFVMRETGSAVILSNFTTSVGFASLLLASHRGLSSLGLLASLGIISILFAYITLFPIFIKVIEKLRLKLR